MGGKQPKAARDSSEAAKEQETVKWRQKSRMKTRERFGCRNEAAAAPWGHTARRPARYG